MIIGNVGYDEYEHWTYPEHGKNGWVLEDYELDEKTGIGHYEYSHPSAPGVVFPATRTHK